MGGGIPVKKTKTGLDGESAQPGSQKRIFPGLPWQTRTGRSRTFAGDEEVLDVRRGLRQVQRALALFPQTALLEKLHAFKTLEHAAFGTDGAAAGFEAGMLGHDTEKVRVFLGTEGGAKPLARRLQ